MKRKLLLSLLLLSLSVFIKDIVFADHQDDFSGVKKYDNISIVETNQGTLSWMAKDKIDTSKLFSNSKESKKLEVLSENTEMGIILLDDKSGNNIVMIQGMDEVLLLTYSEVEVKRPYNLLEFKVEDNIVSVEQFNYIKSLISAS